MQWRRAQGPPGSLRSHVHDAEDPEADHAERRRRRDSRWRHRRRHAHAAHGRLAENHEMPCSRRTSAARNERINHRLTPDMATSAAPQPAAQVNLRALLEEMIERDASDLHITAGERAKLRI